MPDPDRELSADDVARIRAHMDAVLASSGFAGSTRLSSFLRYIVEKSLDGKDDEIKEYSIAVEVYGRPADYDTQNESIVRVEASRLRRRLKEYYEGAGRDDEFRIELPRGGYRPIYNRREMSAVTSPLPVTVTTSKSSRRWQLALALVAIAALAAIGLWSLYRGSPASPVDSIAVLPLMNLTGSPAEEAFTEGLTEDLTTSLSKLPGLRVLARTTMAAYKNKPVDLKETGQRLGVGSFLEGSVRRDVTGYVITAQLINAADGYHLWAETYRRPATDPLRLQEGLSREIAARIDERLSGRAPWRTKGRTPPSGEALTLYLEAYSLLQKDVRGLLSRRGIPGHFTQALAKLNRAVQLNPDFAQAWVLLSTSYEFCIDFDPTRAAEFIELAKAAAGKAIEIDDTIGEAHGMLGALAMYRDFDLPAAEAHYRRAVELQPRDTSILRYYSDILRILGRPAESMKEIDRAILLSPTDNRLFMQKSLLFYSEGRYEEAFKTLEGVLSAAPANVEGRWLKGLLFQATGRMAEAERQFRGVLNDRPEDMRAIPALGHLLGSMGRKEEAAAVAARLQKRIDEGFLNHYGMALIYCGMKENEKAVDWLERAVKSRDQSLIYLMVEERLRPLHNDPRVRQIASRYRIAFPAAKQ